MTGQFSMSLLAVASLLLANSTAEAFVVPDATSPIRTVVFSGDVAPGTGGRQFDSFSAPAINRQGQLSFPAQLECCTPRSTLYSTGSGALELVGWQSSAAVPGSSTTFSNGFGAVQIDDFGRTMVRAQMNGLPREFVGIYVGQENQMLQKVVESGDPVEPSEPETYYYGIDFAHFGAGGVVAGRAVSRNTTTSPTSDVLWKWSEGGPVEPILRVGDTLDFLPPNFEIGAVAQVAFDNPVVNKVGQIAVRTATIDTESEYNFEPMAHILLIEPDNTYTKVVSTGDPLPAWPTIPAGGTFYQPSLPVINNAGGVAFGEWSSFPGTIFRKLPGQDPEVVVNGQDPVPGMPGVRFDYLFVNGESEMPLWIADNGDVAFWSSLVGEPIGNEFAESVWIGSPGDLRSVAIERTEAPGTGGVFASSSSTIGDMVYAMAVNARGQVAMAATYQVPGDSQRLGLFATDLDGELQKIVAPGDLLETSPGVVRQVSDVNFLGDQQGKLGTGLSDLGEIAFHARFTDGTEGVFISRAVAVPEVASLVPALVMSLLLVAVARTSVRR